MFKRIVVLAVVPVVAVAGFLAYQRIGEGRETVDFADPSQRPPVGEMAFESPRESFRLTDLKGRIVLADVWATWCAPCVAAIPELTALQERYRGDLVVVGLNVDEGGWEAVDPFLRRRPDINYPVVRPDPPARILFNTLIDVPPLGKVSALPTTFLIDRQGRLVSKYVGGGTLPEIEGDIRQLLRE